jgi:hypothetical protein
MPSISRLSRMMGFARAAEGAMAAVSLPSPLAGEMPRHLGSSCAPVQAACSWPASPGRGRCQRIRKLWFGRASWLRRSLSAVRVRLWSGPPFREVLSQPGRGPAPCWTSRLPRIRRIPIHHPRRQRRTNPRCPRPAPRCSAVAGSRCSMVCCDESMAPYSKLALALIGSAVAGPSPVLGRKGPF